MENKFTPELIEKAKSAKTPEELMALAKENGTELTEESAKAYFEQLNPKTGELADEELNNVAGGGCLPWADDPYDTCMADGYCLSDYVCNRCAQGVLTLAPVCCIVPDVLQATPAVGTV